MPDWPGDDRRHPRVSSPSWVIRAPLAAWLERQAHDAHAAYGRYRVLDVGAGIKPYFPFFEPFADEYVAVDIGPSADLQGTAEALPVADASYDVILCTQVLEHCNDPAQAVRELRRVAKPGGLVLASTHGVMPFHPAPNDEWRWTHTGLGRLFRDNAEWTSVTVAPGAGTGSCLGMLAAYYIDLLFHRAHARVLARPLVAAANRIGSALDRATPLLREPVPGALFANYHVEAIR